MTSSQELFRSAEHSSGSFVIAATTQQFNDRVSAMNEVIFENFWKGSAHLADGAHAGIHFSNVIMAEPSEYNYAFDEHLIATRPFALNAMKQVVQQGLDMELTQPDVIGNSIAVKVLETERINVMRRFFGSVARVPEMEQPTADTIDLIDLSDSVPNDEQSRLASFIKNVVKLQPIRAPFSTLQLWEISSGKIKSAQIVGEVSFKIQ